MGSLTDAYGIGQRPSATPLETTEHTDENVRCWRCGRLLAELVTRPWRIKCARCKARNEGSSGGKMAPDPERARGGQEVER